MSERRMIEDYIPVDRISYESAREKVSRRRQGHLSTMHLWWARRPLAACRAAVYATFAPPATGEDRERAPAFFEQLCQWTGPVLPTSPALEAARAVVSTAGEGGSPPVVLDMFGGGGAIPLEAQRLGAIPWSVDLNPVAHLIQRCTLEFPQRYGQDLRDAVARWGEEVIARTQAEVGDLYPDIPVPEDGQLELGFGKRTPKVLRPIAYLWTRTIPTPARGVEGTVPLVRQTWLQQKPGGWTALRPKVDGTRVRFDLVTSKARTKAGAVAEWGFDPSNQSARGKTTCQFSGSTVTAKDVKAAGQAGSLGSQLMAACVVDADGRRGKSFVDVPSGLLSQPDWQDVERRISAIGAGLSPPSEPLENRYNQAMLVPAYGMTRYQDLSNPRQLLTLLTLCKHIRAANIEIARGQDREFAGAVCSYLALLLGRLADRQTMLCRWISQGSPRTAGTYARQALPMLWDYSEANPFGGSSGDSRLALDFILQALDHCVASGGTPANCHLGPAQSLPFEDETVDAVVTDPPYYDYISYGDLSDFFYVWHKRALATIFPRSYATKVTPKKAEAVGLAYRHGKSGLVAHYEEEMGRVFAEAHRVLKPSAPMVVVYAHKTTLGWSTLVDSLLKAGFQVTEAWPLQTEKPDRIGTMHQAALASSIFLVARKRGAGGVGSFAEEVLPEMRTIVQERVKDLMAVGLGGADLVIAAVGAGLRPFTRYDTVELPNGDPYTSEAFLDQVQREVFDTVLAEVFQVGGGDVGAIDTTSRAYVLFRYQYEEAVVPFGDANVLAQGIGVELSGVGSLSDGAGSLVEEKKGKVRLRTYTERGAQQALGLPLHGAPAPLVDVLHRLLWLMEHERAKAPRFLAESGVDAGRLRLLANALKGRSLSREGESRTDEQNAVQRLLAQWSGLFSQSPLFSR